MTGYWVVTASPVTDREAFDEYVKHWAPVAKKYGAKTLAARNRHETREGPDPARVTLVEFPSYADAIACYDDPAYQAALPFVRKAGQRNLVIVEGM